ncbi:hypothetical protein AWV79_29960 [Cupriavidus sp. UYMMa02A]|nr:hypothetical protein AWV79_29960 [Cupriavidus sp. UYMMa02A]
MTLINTAYEVLMDPVKRAQHDAWIVAQEKAKAVAPAMAGQRARPASAATGASAGTPSRPARQGTPGGSAGSRTPKDSSRTANPAGTSTASKALFVLVAAGAAIYLIIPTHRESTDASVQGSAWLPSVSAVPSMTGESQAAPGPQSKPPAALTQYMRKPTAPNGQPWPAWSSYIPGYPIRKTGGRSSLTVDNSRNPSDVFLKVFSLDDGDTIPVRFALIKLARRSSFPILRPAVSTFAIWTWIRGRLRGRGHSNSRK